MVGFLAYSILAIAVISLIIVCNVLKWIFEFIGDKLSDKEIKPDHKLTIKDIDSWFDQEKLEETRRRANEVAPPGSNDAQLLDILFPKK